MNTEEDFLATWGNVLPEGVLAELTRDVGKRGTKTRARELRQLGITVPFKAAWPVFVEKTMPRYYADTKAIYPSLERLDGLCRSVLVSLVFNRGNDLKGKRRREMREIQAILKEADREGLDEEQITSILARVEDQIVSMKRLWDPGSGLIKRRQAEANLWRAGLARRQTG